eukprot:3065917-Pyramimonas_sp.AAC.1
MGEHCSLHVLSWILDRFDGGVHADDEPGDVVGVGSTRLHERGGGLAPISGGVAGSAAAGVSPRSCCAISSAISSASCSAASVGAVSVGAASAGAASVGALSSSSSCSPAACAVVASKHLGTDQRETMSAASEKMPPWPSRSIG